LPPLGKNRRPPPQAYPITGWWSDRHRAFDHGAANSTPSVTGKPTNPFAVSKIQPDSPSGILCMGLFFQNLICFSIFLLFFKVLIDCSWSAMMSGTTRPVDNWLDQRRISSAVLVRESRTYPSG
jgi:hypothetical protein